MKKLIFILTFSIFIGLLSTGNIYGFEEVKTLQITDVQDKNRITTTFDFNQEIKTSKKIYKNLEWNTENIVTQEKLLELADKFNLDINYFEDTNQVIIQSETILGLTYTLRP